MPVEKYIPKTSEHLDLDTFISYIAFEQPELYLLADFLAADKNTVSQLASLAWKARLKKIRTFIEFAKKPKSLLPESIDVKSGQWTSESADLTANSYEPLFNLIRSYRP